MMGNRLCFFVSISQCVFFEKRALLAVMTLLYMADIVRI